MHLLRVSGIDRDRPFFKIRPGTRFLADYDFRPHGTIYGPKSKSARKNLFPGEKRIGVLDF